MEMKSLLLTAVAVYLLLVLTVCVLQRRMMYFPDPATPNPTAAQVGMQDVRLGTTDGLSLAAWYRPPPTADAPVLLYFHGNAGHHGDRAPVVAKYVRAGYGVLLASYRGYGGNPGSPTETGLYADGRAALDWLVAQGIDAGRVVLYGESLGSGVAVQLAQERHAAGAAVGAVVLQAPFTSTADVGARHYWYLPVRLLLRDRFDSASKIAEIGAPLLVLYSSSDVVVPPRLSRALFAAAHEPKELIDYPAAGHNGFDRTDAAEDVMRFVARRLR